MPQKKSFLFYLGHPAQYHFLKNVVITLRKNGHFVKYVIRTKDILEELLLNNGENYVNILPEGRKSNKTNIMYALLKREFRLYHLLKKEKYDLLIGSDPSIAHMGKLFKIPSMICTEDDYKVIHYLARLAFPYADCIFAPIPCNVGKWGDKKIAYNGYQKLACLHPNYFIPEKNKVLINANDKYFLIRLSSLSAHHDFGIKGFSKKYVFQIIDILSKYGRVLISSENVIDEELKKYKLEINPNDIHHYLYFAELFISDSQSMSIEAALLGTPSLRFSDFSGRISVLEELEKKYDLTYGFNSTQFTDLVSKLNALLSIKNLKEEFQNKRLNMLKDKIDVTKFMVWLLENYPDSINTVRENPNYQFSFK